MAIQFSSTPVTDIATNHLVLGFAEKTLFSAELKAVDEALGGALTRLKERGELTGKQAEITYLPNADGIAADRVYVIGLGDPNKICKSKYEQALLTVFRRITSKPDQTLAFCMPPIIELQLDLDVAVSSTAYCLCVAGSGNELYKSEPGRHALLSATIHEAIPQADEEIQKIEKAINEGMILGAATNLTRELVNRHPNDIYPETFANRAGDVAADLGIHGKILDQHDIEKENMGALLGVSRGSCREPRVVVLNYNGGKKNAPTLALCGKGVTFDSGGLSIKPSAGMLTMKADMAGAATVLGAMYAIARLKLPVNIIGVLGLVENMVSGSSYMLGEVVTARNGVSIEIHNTDAEGRLVLADILSYAVDQGATKLIDLATLTGACVVALGEEVTGAFSNNQDWCNEILSSGKTADEAIWQLPMFDSFGEQLRSEFADTKNVGTRWGGAITAAKFLEKFVSEKPWVHLDIAGPSYAENSKPHQDTGGTGAMVRTLVEVAKNFGK